MKFSLILATLLYFTTWMNLVRTDTAPVQNCPCLAQSNRQIRFTEIESYTIQEEGICSIKAVVFITKNGNTICSDPKSKWAKQTIKKLDTPKIRPSDEGFTKLDPTTKSSTTKRPNEEESTKLNPTTKSSTTGPNEEDSTKLNPTTKSSTTKRPNEEDSTKLNPTTKSSTTGPNEEDSTKLDPTTKSSSTKKSNEEDYTKLDPAAKSSTTTGPNEEESTNPDPTPKTTLDIEQCEEISAADISPAVSTSTRNTLPRRGRITRRQRIRRRRLKEWQRTRS